MPLSDFLDQRCDILRQVVSQDAAGGVVRSHEMVYAGVPCLVRPMGGSAQPTDNRAVQTTLSRVYFDTDYGLTTTHQLRVGTRILSISSIVDANSMGEVFSVDCSEQVR